MEKKIRVNFFFNASLEKLNLGNADKFWKLL